jgi:hypothetical protein
MTTRLTKVNNQTGNEPKRVSAAKDEYPLVFKKPSENE